MGTGSDIMMQELEELLGMGLFSFLISYIPSLLMSLAIYIVTALSLYTMAKRRGIHNPWLAWVPIANMWLLGCISDHYRSVARGEVKNRRKVLLGTYIATEVLAVAIVAMMFGMLADILEIGFDVLDAMPEEQAIELAMSLMGSLVGSLLLFIPMVIVAVVYTVFYYIALHDIFKSCDPSNATLYLVLSIFVGITLPVFLFICRNKDDGLPVPQEPQPAYEIPQWNPVEPPVEPWQENHE